MNAARCRTLVLARSGSAEGFHMGRTDFRFSEPISYCNTLSGTPVPAPISQRPASSRALSKAKRVLPVPAPPDTAARVRRPSARMTRDCSSVSRMCCYSSSSSGWRSRGCTSRAAQKRSLTTLTPAGPRPPTPPASVTPLLRRRQAGRPCDRQGGTRRPFALGHRRQAQVVVLPVRLGELREGQGRNAEAPTQKRSVEGVGSRLREDAGGDVLRKSTVVREAHRDPWGTRSSNQRRLRGQSQPQSAIVRSPTRAREIEGPVVARREDPAEPQLPMREWHYGHCLEYASSVQPRAPHRASGLTRQAERLDGENSSCSIASRSAINSRDS